MALITSPVNAGTNTNTLQRLVTVCQKVQATPESGAVEEDCLLIETDEPLLRAYSLGLDSLGTTEFVTALEEEFQRELNGAGLREVPDEVRDTWDTVGDVADFFDALGKEKEQINVLQPGIHKDDHPPSDLDILRDRVFSALLAMEHSPVSEEDLVDANEDTLLKDNLEFDSLDVIEFAITLEEDFGIEILDEVSLNWKTIGDVVDYLVSVT